MRARKAHDAVRAAAVIAHVNPDVLVLAGIDYDHGLATLGAFADELSRAGVDYPHHFAQRPNTGMPTGLDVNGDGNFGDAVDAQGYGRYSGEKGLAILSRYPFLRDEARDFSEYLWRDLPDANLPEVDGAPYYSDEVLEVLRLSTTAHWDVPIETDNGPLHLLTYYATPPVFDGAEDRNGKRNADETRFWTKYLNGELSEQPANAPFALIGNANLDPHDGDGNGAAIAELLAHPSLQDPKPASVGGVEAANASHSGDPALDTAAWPVNDKLPGNLRVEYVLPSRDLKVLDAGVFWPETGTEEASLIAEGEGITRHRLVWVDVEMP
ncbi:endonuclease/exonuclease/phosphatase family protein [Halocynthiibacter sp. C4]|uniref:endonuclease/exonuclease/phosphatase family protein n=1 Tax=Halocynthiibacter sp. C4 TaxID=2992758 RepID=UPI00237BFC2C|nr:endonuclease/exonuclease/phosphatase family protein [Halocynthiibacter sp. C4]MDE0590854.1 endonuclease/exonuclease/phosphatase family protein [Halocynthiibacter sp. C4]